MAVQPFEGHPAGCCRSAAGAFLVCLGAHIGADYSPSMVVSSRAEKRSASPAVTMAAAVLDVLATASPGCLGPSEIGRRLGVAKSSVANVCSALAKADLVRREGTAYVLGPRLAELGATYLDGVDEIKTFHDVCAEYLPAPEETVQMAVMGSGLDVAHLARRDGSVRIQLVLDVGRHLPASCTATGKALLAGLPEAELERRLAGASLTRFTSHSITDADQLKADLATTRARGWAIDDQELIDGVLCIAAAVPHARSAPTHAVSFTLLRAWATPERCDRLGQQLVEVSAIIADRLGQGRRMSTIGA
jgi:DNA-binding IclR family transcriptional regulator